MQIEIIGGIIIKKSIPAAKTDMIDLICWSVKIDKSRVYVFSVP
jgi:hypothetical protein